MSDLVRVTVAADSRRVDVAVPVGLPLVELVPDLALRSGVSGRHRAGPHGLAVLTPGGERLDPEHSLAAQHVGQGAVLVLAPEDEVRAPRHDDSAAALAEVVERRVAAWRPGAGPAAALAGAATLLVLSGVGALGWGLTAIDAASPGASSRRSVVGAVVATAAGSGVLALATALAARSRGRAAARVLGLGSVWHGAVAGAVVGAAVQGAPGFAVLCAGVAALAAALVCLVALPHDSLALLPAVVVGVAAITGGGALVLAPGTGSVVVAGGLAAAVVGSLPLPRLALALARASIPGGHADRRAASPDTDLDAEGLDGAGQDRAALDEGRLEAQAVLAHRLVVATELGLAVLVVLLCPLAVALGPAGAAVALAAGTATLVRARRFRAAAPAAIGVVAGGTALVVAAATALVLHPGARGALAGLLVAAGLALAAAPVLRPGPGWHRAADVTETVSLTALVPLFLVATGVPGQVATAVASLVHGAGA